MRHPLRRSTGDALIARPARQLIRDPLILIGQSMACRLIFTVYAERDADVIRIISARKATRAERMHYEEGEF